MTAAVARDSAASLRQARAAGQALFSSWFVGEEPDALDLIDTLLPSVWPDETSKRIANAIRTVCESGQNPDEFAVGCVLAADGLSIGDFSEYALSSKVLKNRTEMLEVADAMVMHRARTDITTANIAGDLKAVREIATFGLEWRDTIGTDVIPVEDVLGAEAPPPSLFAIGMWTRTLSLLLSASGLGKSTLAIQMAAAVATGRTYGIKALHPGYTGKVLVWSPEDPASVKKSRLEALAWDHDDRAVLRAVEDGRIVFLAGGDDPLMAQARPGDPVHTTRLFDGLRAAIRKYKPVLVILDPLSHVAALASENDNSAMMTVGKILSRLAREYDTCILLIHHVSKSGADTPSQHSARGASALACNSRWIGHFFEDTDTGDLGLWPVKHSYGRNPGPVYMKRETRGSFRQVALEARDPRLITVALIEVLRERPDLSVTIESLGRRAALAAVEVIEAVRERITWAKPKDIQAAGRAAVEAGTLILEEGQDKARRAVLFLRVPQVCEGVPEQGPEDDLELDFDDEVPF